jgi:hypothetical protein
MATSTPTAPTNPGAALRSILTTPYTYIAVLVLLFVTVFSAYAVTLVPEFIGIGGASVGILALAAFLSQDLEGQPVPAGWPMWSTFIVIIVVGGLEAGVGQLKSSTPLTEAGVLGLVVFVAQWIINALNQDAGQNIPTATEMQLVALLGILVTALMGISPNGTANVQTLEVGALVTAVASFGGYTFAREKANARVRAARIGTPSAPLTG